MRRATCVGVALAALVFVLMACSGGPDPIRVGAVYPLSGSQGPGGLQEFQGLEVAEQLVNGTGGVGGRPIELTPMDAPASAAAAPAVQALHRRGIRFVVGSYGSTISNPASAEAARQGMLFWESGAVGMLASPYQGSLVFRFAPTGVVLGRHAISFIADQLASRMHRDPSRLRFAVANVNDVYGSNVARGAVSEIRELGLPFAGQFPYDAASFSPRALVHRIAAAHPDVLFVSAYLQDGVAVRREIVREHLHLVANIGSSSSYCMQAFGDALGKDAVGVFASDKPDAGVLNPNGLLPSARALQARAIALYRQRFHTSMSAAALAGFSAGWTLFRLVMPRATALTPQAVAAAALHLRVPTGGLPNGSGVDFAPAGSPDAGANLLAASVIWEWQAVDWRVVVWPPRFATAPIRLLPLA